MSQLSELFKLNCVRQEQQHCRIKPVKTGYTEMSILKGLRSGKLVVSLKGDFIVTKYGNQVAEVFFWTSKKSKFYNWYLPILTWPAEGSFWQWFQQVNDRGFISISFIFIAFGSFLIANALFKGEVYGVGFFALGASPLVTLIILKSTYIKINYQKGGRIV